MSTYSDYLPLRKGPPPPQDTHSAGVRVYADEDGALHTLQSDGTDDPVGGGGTFNGGTITEDLEVAPTDNATAPIINVQAPVGFNENSSGALLELVDEGGDAALIVNSSGHLSLNAPEGRGDSLQLLQSVDNAGRAVALGTGFGVAVTSDAGALEIDNESGARQFIASGSMGVVFAVHAAPSSGDLNAGECALWFDQTNGAAKLMIKAKTADGTVVTGNVPLS